MLPCYFQWRSASWLVTKKKSLPARLALRPKRGSDPQKENRRRKRKEKADTLLYHLHPHKNLCLDAQIFRPSCFQVDGLQSDDAAASLKRITSVLGVVMSVAAFATASRVSTMGIVGERIALRLRRVLYQSLLRQEIEFFDRGKSGELINRLSTDVTSVSKFLTDNLTVSKLHHPPLTRETLLRVFSSTQSISSF